MFRKLILLIVIIFLIAGCTKNETSQDKTIHETISDRNFLIGIAGFVPANYPNPTDSDWKDLFSSIQNYGEVFGDYLEWNDNLKEGIPNQIRIINELSKQQNFIPVYALGFKNAGSFAEIKDGFEEVAINVAKELQPKYLGLGVEVNLLYEKNPNNFEEYIKTYQELYIKIKEISPKTKVFPIFQLEYTKGKGQLSGQKRSEEWFLIEKFEDQMDLAVFTTYPMLDYEDPKDIPEDYYSEITKHTKKAIAFTEFAWLSGTINGRSSSEEEQAEFLSRFLDLTKNLDKEFVIWTLPHDTNNNDLFGTIGLKKNNGNKKLVYYAWMELK